MSAWRETLRDAKRDVHREMCVASVYLGPGSDATARRVDVRDHTRIATANVSGVGEGFAQMLDTAARLVLDRQQVSKPVRNAIVAMSATEAYRLGASRPPEGEWVTVEVTALSEEDAAALWQAEWAELLA